MFGLSAQQMEYSDSTKDFEFDDFDWHCFGNGYWVKECDDLKLELEYDELGRELVYGDLMIDFDVLG